MSQKILAIGNALVDIIARVDHEQLLSLNLTPGSMDLVDQASAKAIYDNLLGAREVSGGSAANTACVAARLGSSVYYVGKTSADALGDIFLHDMAVEGITSIVPPSGHDHHTGHCLSLITPDAQRTMCTHLGAAQTLMANDIPMDAINAADVVFIEAYLLDTPQGYDIFHKLMDANCHGLALTLSDARCVERHLDIILQFLPYVDILFGNEEEVKALFPRENGTEAAARRATQHVITTVITDGPNGAYAGELKKITHIPARKVDVVDTTGAGDSLAGTVLWGILNGHSLVDSVHMGMRVAAEVIGEIGARPSRDIKEILRNEGFLPGT